MTSTYVMIASMYGKIKSIYQYKVVALIYNMIISIYGVVKSMYYVKITIYSDAKSIYCTVCDNIN